MGRRRSAGDRRGRAGGAGALSADLELAERAARAAGALLLERYGGPASGVARKSSRTDMVSDADRDAEALIRELLASERPDDGLLGEEGSQADGSSGRRWVVDPLDGTTNYLYGFPAWAVSIALEDAPSEGAGGAPGAGVGGGLVGVVHDPLREETFAATRNGGATLNGAPIAVSGERRLDSALIGTGFGYAAQRRADQAAIAARVLPRVRDIRRAGAAALDLCMVACGRLDGYYERGLNAWDWSAGSLIASEAGASVLPLTGEPFGLVVAAPAIAEPLAALVDTVR